MYPIAGREYILSVLTGYLDAALDGAGACVLLEGLVGTGKSRMLRAVALEGAERGLAVARMRAGAIEDAPVLREMAVFLNSVASGHGQFDDAEWADMFWPDANPFVVADQLGEMIDRAARRRPLLIILDDAQRTDEVSAVALQALVRSHATAPVLWLLARTPARAQSLAQHALGWLCDRVAVQLHLGMLDDEAAAALCAHVLGAKPDASVLTWAGRCGGHPLLLERLMQALIDAGRVVVVDGTASVLAERLPDGVLSALRPVLDVVPAGVREMLLPAGPGAASGQGAAVPAGPLTDVMQLPVSKPPRAELWLPGRADQWPTREAPVAGELTGRRGQPSGAVHPAEAPQGRQACACATIGDHARAALGDPFEAPVRLARALRLLAGAGRAEEAGRLADVAARTGLDPVAEAQLTTEFVPGLQSAARHDLAIAQLRRTLGRRDLSEADRADLEGLLTGAVRRAAAARAVDASSDGHPAADGHGSTLVRPDRAEAGCDTCGSPSWAWIVHGLIAADRFEDAETVAAAIRTAVGRAGDVCPEVQWHGHRAEILMALGRLGEARVAAETGLRLSDRSTPDRSTLTRAVLARISLHYGDMATASDHLRAAERVIADNAAADRIRLEWALAQFHAACGRPRMAVQTLIKVDAKTDSDMLLFTEAPTAAATLVRLSGKAGLTMEAERAVAYARWAAERNPGVASLAGAAEHADGLLRRDLDALRAAVECYRRGGRPLATGIALEDVADEEQEGHRQSRAVESLGSALDLYSQCDARRDVARVQKKLRRLGAADAGDAGLGRPTSGWESLTTAELRVVRAIVDGKTNKEAANTLYLSPHTVDSHLRRVFGKLGINTRVELTKHFLTRGAA